MTDRRKLKQVVLILAALELLVVAVYAVTGVPMNKLLAAAALLIVLLASLRYFWQRLSGRQAQFGNLVVRANEPFDELDKLMIVGHAVAVLVGIPVALA